MAEMILTAEGVWMIDYISHFIRHCDFDLTGDIGSYAGDEDGWLTGANDNHVDD